MTTNSELQVQFDTLLMGLVQHFNRLIKEKKLTPADAKVAVELLSDNSITMAPVKSPSGGRGRPGSTTDSAGLTPLSERLPIGDTGK